MCTYRPMPDGPQFKSTIEPTVEMIPPSDPERKRRRTMHMAFPRSSPIIRSRLDNKATSPIPLVSLLAIAVLAMAGAVRSATASEIGQATNANAVGVKRQSAVGRQISAVNPYEAGEPGRRMPRAGSCHQTIVKEVTSRLIGVRGSGTTIIYTDGHAQVSYDRIREAERSRPGDAVRLCVVSIPRNCPIGDLRGVMYRATNLRTLRSWSALNAEHSCGGA